MFFFFAHIPFVVNHTINATPPERSQQYLAPLAATGSYRKIAFRNDFHDHVPLSRTHKRGYKRYIVPWSGRYWEDENTHAMCFCNKAQNYLCVPVASMPIDLFLYLGMVAVLSTF